MDQDALLDPKLREKYGSRRNLPWLRRRIEQLADVLRLPVEAVWAWHDDWQREAVAVASWEQLQTRMLLHADQDAVGRWHRDPASPRAIAQIRRFGLSVEDVRRADERSLLALDGMGPKSIRSLRQGVLLAAQATEVLPMPAWVSEE